MLDRLRNSDVPLDWMFVMFGITFLVTAACTGGPYLGLLLWGIPTKATVQRIEPSLQEVPLEGPKAGPTENSAEALRDGPGTDRPKKPKKGSESGNQPMSEGAPERFAHLTFPLTHKREGAGTQGADVPEGPIDTGSFDGPNPAGKGFHKTKLKIPPGTVTEFDDARQSGEAVDIVYRKSDPDYLLRERDLYRISVASGGVVLVGVLCFLLAWVLSRDGSD